MGNFIFCAVCVALFTTIWKIHFFLLRLAFISLAEARRSNIIWFGNHKKQQLQTTFSINDFFSKCDQIRWKLRIWSHLLKKFLMENLIFYAVCLIKVLPLCFKFFEENFS